jgi:hypothetical protein
MTKAVKSKMDTLLAGSVVYGETGKKRCYQVSEILVMLQILFA